MNKPARLKITLDAVGSGKVVLNDIDISDCLNAIEFSAGHGKLTEVKLTIFAEVDADITAKLDQIALAKLETPPATGIRFLKSERVRPPPSLPFKRS